MLFCIPDVHRCYTQKSEDMHSIDSDCTQNTDILVCLLYTKCIKQPDFIVYLHASEELFA